MSDRCASSIVSTVALVFLLSPTSAHAGHRPDRTSGIDGDPRLASLAAVVAARGDFTTQDGRRFVDDDAPPGGDGLCWQTAFTDLQDALDDAVEAGGSVAEIRVAWGTYLPDRGTRERDATFQLITGVALRGGYAGLASANPELRDPDLFETILSGDLAGDDGPAFEGNDENSYHVVTGSNCGPTAIMEGFTITAGNANDQDSEPSFYEGGGVHIESGSPTFRACSIRGNWAVVGGAIGSRSSLSVPVTIEHCTFTGNTAQAGGAIFNRWADVNMTGCTLEENYALRGGAIYNGEALTMTGCMLAGNDAGWGGAIFSEAYMTLQGCTFVGNYADYHGGGIHLEWAGSTTLTDCTIADNVTQLAGGGICCKFSNPTFINCVIKNNRNLCFE